MRLALAVLVVAASPVGAQDLSGGDLRGQYDAAVAAFVLPGQEEGDAYLYAEAMTALLPTLEGDWAPAWLLAQGGPIDATAIAEACDRPWVPTTLARTAPHSFEMQRPSGPEGARVPVRFEYLIGNSFQRTLAEADVTAMLGFEDGRIENPLAFLDVARGEVLLFHPSPDILVIHAVGGPAEIYARCP